jgi:hypothetical protein
MRAAKVDIVSVPDIQIELDVTTTGVPLNGLPSTLCPRAVKYAAAQESVNNYRVLAMLRLICITGCTCERKVRRGKGCKALLWSQSY